MSINLHKKLAKPPEAVGRPRSSSLGSPPKVRDSMLKMCSDIVAFPSGNWCFIIPSAEPKGNPCLVGIAVQHEKSMSIPMPKFASLSGYPEDAFLTLSKTGVVIINLPLYHHPEQNLVRSVSIPEHVQLVNWKSVADGAEEGLAKPGVAHIVKIPTTNLFPLTEHGRSGQ